MLDPALAYPLVRIFGLINLVGLALVILSCRCLIGPWAGGWLFKMGWYKKFYQYHCWYWVILILSVILHVSMSYIVRGG